TGEITSLELQPRFTLQPAFTKNDKKFKAITYSADFMVYLPNGDVEVVDIKGIYIRTSFFSPRMFR
ncbi:DUF1064 domain-containing protein, partial [Bacillus sp. D-CC]